MYTSPALAFVLAAGGRSPDARAGAIKQVKEGRPSDAIRKSNGIGGFLDRRGRLHLLKRSEGAEV